MDRALALFEQRHYWACHEELEDLWLEARQGNEKNIYWTLIHLSVAMYHFENQNFIGAKDQILRAKKKVEQLKNPNDQERLMMAKVSWEYLSELFQSYSLYGDQWSQSPLWEHLKKMTFSKECGP